MVSMLFTWVFLQAVLLWNIHCSPVKNGGYSGGGYSGGGYSGGGSTGGGSSEAPGYNPGYYSAGSLPGPRDQDGSAVGIPPPPPGYSKGSPPGAPQDVPWAIRPSIMSGGDAGPDTSNASPASGFSDLSPPHPPSGSEFIPGELLRIENTMEDGGYESETQERGLPPLPPYKVAGTGSRVSVSLPRRYFGFFYPYDRMLLAGQYPPGTYTHSSSSVERGRDDWQENRYLRYDYPSSPMEEEEVQTFPGDSDQSFQMPGDQEGAGWDMGKATPY